jgi:hypothetical protein
MMRPQTEFEFTLPIGFIDQDGNVHRDGVMRLATAMDEIAPLRDLRVRSNQAYLAIILLSRVVTRLGTLPSVTTNVIENLYAADLAYLQTLYRQINEQGKSIITLTCPECNAKFEVDLAELGGSTATP